MTVKNEQESSSKYNYLYYVEFLEFLCRVTLNYDKKDLEPIDKKVFQFLKILFQYRIDQELEDPEEFELLELVNDSDGD